MRTPSSLVALLLVVFSAGCGGEGSGSGSSAAASGSGAPASAKAVAEADDNAPEEPNVKVLDKGADPKKKLRYQVADGTVETLVLVQSRSQAVIGQKSRSVPASKLTIALTAKGKTAAGDRDWSYEVKDATVESNDPAGAAFAKQVQAELKKVVGLNGTFVVTDRGYLRKVEPAKPAGQDPTTAQFAEGLGESMQVAYAPLPAAAVGVGARWEHSFDVRQSGIMVKLVTRYEVVSISGDEVKLKTTQSQNAGKQMIDAGGGQKIEISNYKLDATGTITLNLKHLAARESKNESQGSMMLEGLGKAAKEVKITTSVLMTGT